MPELPEVQALAEFLAQRLVGRVIGRVVPVAVSVMKTYDPPPSALEGRAVTAVGRRGKFLVMTADGLHLAAHLARAGRLRWREDLPKEPPRPGRGPLALRLQLAAPPASGFDLTEAGTAKRLAVYCVRDPLQVPGIARLGPDPLDAGFTREVFAGLLHGERRQLKGMLRDQSTVAGIGNAYSDEVLHAARMSPFKLAGALSPDEADRLYGALRGTLEDALARSRRWMAGEPDAEKKSGLRVHGRTGCPCPVCGDTVREVSFSDSSLQYCPTCQTGGRLLADRRLSRLLK